MSSQATHPESSARRSGPPAAPNSNDGLSGLHPHSEALQPQDLVITLLGAYVRPNPRPVWSGGLVRIMEEFGFSGPAARVALARLVRRGFLERVKQGRLVHYTLSERSAHLLAEGDRRIFSLGWDDDWDGTWTVLWHSIPEDQRLARARLARRLRFLGFGSVHDGTWISPHDREEEVAELLAEVGVEDYADVLLGRPAKSVRIDTLIARAWDLDDLAQRYEGFVNAFKPYGSRTRLRSLDDREAFLVRTMVVHSFRRFPFLDPDLPDELMPRPTPRREAAGLFHAIYDALAEPAQRHFDSLTS
jgi:phenylacetic acid degradation operon negative regulatory protein